MMNETEDGAVDKKKLPIFVLPRKRIHYNALNFSDDLYDKQRIPSQSDIEQEDPLDYFDKTTKTQPIQMSVKGNTKIVFVGASETALACIGKMLSKFQKALFKKITVVDACGFPGQLKPNKARDEFFAVKAGCTSMSFSTYTEWVRYLGFEKWVKVVQGTVSNIDRDAKQVVVDKNMRIPFDILILTPGLQFQRIDCPEPEIDYPSFISFKKKTRNLKGDFSAPFKRLTPKPQNVFEINTEFDAETALQFLKREIANIQYKKVLIFGGGLRSLACVKALLYFGMTADKIIFITPPTHEVEWETKSGYIMTDTVRIPIQQELKRFGIKTIENYEFKSWEEDSESGFIKRTYFESPTEADALLSLPTFAFFCFRYQRVNDDIVSALCEAHLLFQDGIIIDEGFKTLDKDIYAAGPATTYKQNLLANHQDHRYYQSEEVGNKLAEFLINRIRAKDSICSSTADIQNLEIARFQRPFVRAVRLLGGWDYMYMRNPGAPHHLRCFDPNGKCDEACECTTEIVTGSIDSNEDPQQKYIKIQLDDASRIVGMECMSKKRFSASNFTGLYGQHEALLNRLMERLEKGEIPDLYEHFSQPWISALCSDRWEPFLQDLKHLYKVHDIGEGQRIADFIREYVANLDKPDAIQIDPNMIRNIWDNSGLKLEVELRFIAFLQFHKLSLPMYARNDYVEDLLEERSTSTLYYPKVSKY